MIPNINSDKNTFLVKCRCGALEHIFQFYYDEEDKTLDVDVIKETPSLWSAIMWWWRSRKVWFADITLDKEDIEHLIKYLKELN